MTRMMRVVLREPAHSGSVSYLLVALLTGVPCLCIGLIGLLKAGANLGLFALVAAGLSVILVRTAEFLPTAMRGLTVALRVAALLTLLAAIVFAVLVPLLVLAWS